MSLFPVFLRSLRPTSWMDHHLRMMRQMEALISSPVHPGYHIEWKEPWYLTPDKSNNFSVRLDVKNFAPKEITVKTVDDSIIVEGKHEEKTEKGGIISRHFIKSFMLPNGSEAEDVVSSLSAEGILTISAPNKAIASAAEREVPISLEEEKEKVSN